MNDACSVRNGMNTYQDKPNPSYLEFAIVGFSVFIEVL